MSGLTYSPRSHHIASREVASSVTDNLDANVLVNFDRKHSNSQSAFAVDSGRGVPIRTHLDVTKRIELYLDAAYIKI